MSNSLKQSKVLLEGWRKFYLKEAEEPTAGGNVVRIFDFDGTLVSPRTTTKYSQLLNNLFYVPFLNSAKYDEVMNELKQVVKEPSNHNTEIEKLMNPSKDYIVTAMSSIGIDKPITKYLLYQLSKNDPLFMDFAKRVAGVEIESAYVQPVPSGGDEDEYTPEDDIETPSEMAISQEEINALRSVIASDPEIATVKDAYRINTTPQVVRRIITKLGKGFDVGKRVSMKDLEEVKKEIVAAAYPNISKDRIKVSLNIAMLPEDPEQSGIVKGSSGKFKPAKEIAAANPGAKFEVYDNNVTSMSQVRMGLQGKTKEQAELEVEKESDEKFDDKSPLSVLENKIILIKNTLSAAQNTDFKLVQGSKVIDYNNGPFTLGKKAPSTDPKTVGYGGGYRSLRKLASIYIRKRFLPTTESGKGRTSSEIIQLFKKFRTYCDENGYKDLMDCITYQGPGYAMIYKFFEPETIGVEPSFELNKTVAQQLVKLYENAESVAESFKGQAKEEVPQKPEVVEPTEKSKTATKPAVEKPKTTPTPATIQEPSVKQLKQMNLSKEEWDEMTAEEKEEAMSSIHSGDEALYETILKELKPMLAQLSKIANTKRK